MATKISIELLIMVLNNVKSTQDLYSSLLVNRFWCKVTIPILWEIPFGHECRMGYIELRKRALCIRTYISCMDTQARTLLTQNGFDLSSSPPQVTFDYPSFVHKFVINHLVYFISIYSPLIIPQQITGSDQDNNNNENYYEIVIDKSRILFCEICKLIINRCEFLDCFKLVGVNLCYEKYYLSYSDSIGSILKLPGAPNVFKKLESFTSMVGKNEPIHLLYESLALICDNILNMNLEFKSYSQMQLFAKLINAQKRLENLSIVARSNLDFNSFLWAIIGQKESLRSLYLKLVSFYHFEVKSSPIGQFISLQDFYIEDCSGLYRSGSLFFASSLTQLSSFHFRQKCREYPQEFIKKIIEAANINLKNIRLDLISAIPYDIFSAILKYCSKITELTLHILCSEQVILILNNNFNELRKFSFGCGKRFDIDKLLCQMVENVPESIETIEIKMGIFSSDSLKNFFKEWCRKGGGGTKKIIVKCKDRRGLFTLSE
ncbi:8225_t:CDS:1 [Diversispora eburnea]|uniref:8225_t:CDS:1 n=1 Tax=Diversispora eburnea TaxID=1213867 RepID=A0A9N8ZNR2_9GLOM|nr:8225_t:CDS:1 [Diversispora eburnea]